MLFPQVITTSAVGVTGGFMATQKYYYDSLNRIDDSTETISSTQTWRQDFTYDRYGNRNFNQTNTTMPSSFASPAITNPAISTTDNRITSSGYNYDASGNTTFDASLRKFTYDAENKQTKVESTNSSQTVTGTVGECSYDGDGKRVKKYVPSTGETTIFVYDASGKSIAEYSTIVANSADAKVAYLTSDHLGSPRINTDANGAVIARHDYHPFGEEIATSQRTTGLSYDADTIRKQFTGYERDTETDLDFAEARMYLPSLGRFGTCDPIYLSKMHQGNPQRWNAYVYVFNNPLNKIDPDGRKPKVIDVYIAFDNYSSDQIKAIQKALRKSVDPKKYTVNVYGWEQCTSDNVAESLRSKGRTVIVAGHINGIDGEETGELRSNGKPKTAAYSIVLNGGGLLRSDGIYNMNPQGEYIRVNKEKINAENLFVFSCGLTPNAASQFASRMGSGGSFVYGDGGDDTGTEVGVTVKYAAAAVWAVGAGYNAVQTATTLQNLSDQYEKEGVVYQNGDNIIPCQSNGTCTEKRHKLRPKR